MKLTVNFSSNRIFPARPRTNSRIRCGNTALGMRLFDAFLLMSGIQLKLSHRDMNKYLHEPNIEDSNYARNETKSEGSDQRSIDHTK